MGTDITRHGQSSDLRTSRRHVGNPGTSHQSNDPRNREPRDREQRAAAGRFLTLALYAFAVFGWELLVVLLVDPLLETLDGAATPAILHWLVTAAGWTLGVLVVGLVARPRTRRAAAQLRPCPGSPDGAAYPNADPITGRALRIVVVAVALLVSAGGRAAFTGEWKLLHETADLVERFPGHALAAIVALLLYYLAETAVVVLLLRLGQRAGELRFGRPVVPWGGLLLACTWGVVHVFLQGLDAGVYAMAASVLYGLVVVYGPRRAAPLAALIAVAFVL